MSTIIKKDPSVRFYIGKAIAYRTAARYFVPGETGYGLFRSLMRDNAKTAITFAKITKGRV